MTACDPHPPAGARPGVSPAAALIVEGITVRRGARTVLRGVDATIPAASITAIVGRSGVGKSTLIAALNGLITPSAGRIILPGHGDIADPLVLRDHRRRTATIFQEHALIDRLSALDNVLLGLADQRHPLSLRPWPADLRERAARALDEVGLLDRATTRAGRLSGGERQRVGIARALVRRPVLLLGDEPFAAVDPALVRRIGSDLRGLVARHGLAVVLVLHQLDLARRLADQILGMVDGRIAVDLPSDAFDDAAEDRVFGGDASSPHDERN